MWGYHSDSDEFSDEEYIDIEEREKWSLETEYVHQEIPKKEGRTIFNVGKCGKFSLEITFPRPRYQNVKLFVLSPCPIWIRNTSEIGDGDPINDHEEFRHSMRGQAFEEVHQGPSRQIYQMEKKSKPNRDSIKLYLKYRTHLSCVHPQDDLQCKHAKVTFPLMTSLSSTYESLFESGDSSDAVFQVGDVEIPVHKLILSTRYEYFKTLFASGMKESMTNRVVLEDADVDTIREVLRFVYRSLPPANLEDKAVQYLPIADRYGMEDLKSICSASLQMLISSDTVLETFSLAQLYSCTDLKKAVVKHVNDQSFKPPGPLYQKAVDHFVIAKGEGNEELQKFCVSVFGKMLDWKNIFQALEVKANSAINVTKFSDHVCVHDGI